MQRYIGLDVHAKSSTAVVVDSRGRRVAKPHVLETNGQVLTEFVKLQPGQLHVCLEEGTQAGWLVELLSPHVAEVVVTHVTESRGPKDDARDAYALAERLRTGAIAKPVFKGVGPYSELRQRVKTHRSLVQDVVRVKNRLKALYRARGLATSEKTGFYGEARREEWLAMLPPSSRCAASLLYAEHDALTDVRDRAHKELVAHSKQHPILKKLATCPGIGVVRAAEIVATVVTPARFRTCRQFWSYCGLAVVMRSSSDWVQTANGGWARAQVTSTRGMSPAANRSLKNVFKGAAITAIGRPTDEPLRAHYDRMLANGTKPNLARLTIARKIAAITLAMWKHDKEYDPAELMKPS